MAECSLCELAAIARAKEAAQQQKMAKRRKTTSRKKTTTRRKRVGGMGGKLQNRQVSIKLMDLLWVAAGGALNYIVVNPLINKLADKLRKPDGSPMLGEHQAEILTGLKAGGSAFAAYYFQKLPKEVRLALFGVTAASGVEIAGQVVPDRMVAINGTGDLFLQVGSTPLLEIPMNSQQVGDTGGEAAVFGMEDPAVYGTGDVFDGVIY